MLTLLAGGRVIDPAHGRDEPAMCGSRTGASSHPGPQRRRAPRRRGRDRDGRRHRHPLAYRRRQREHRAAAAAGACAQRRRVATLRAGCRTRSAGCMRGWASPRWSSRRSRRTHALHAQLELAAIPFIDRAILAVLGNDDFLLELLRGDGRRRRSPTTSARTLAGARALGVKVINPGGAAAFKEQCRARFGLDDVVPDYGVSSRAIILALQEAVTALGVPHPLHLHCNNLGLPGNVETALATIAAAEDLPLHLAHLQFYAYGTEGPRGFSSAAPRAGRGGRTRTPNITVDVGQVMFGQTSRSPPTCCGSSARRGTAHPRKSVDHGRRRQWRRHRAVPLPRNNFHNAVQWAAGLELFLLIDDPWRRVLHHRPSEWRAVHRLSRPVRAADEPRAARANGSPTLPEEAMAVTTLPSIAREYTLDRDRDHDPRGARAAARAWPIAAISAPGARADIAVYRPQADRAAMFREAALVFKDGDAGRARRRGRRARASAARCACAARLRPRDRAAARRASPSGIFGVAHDRVRRARDAIGCARRVRDGAMPRADPQRRAHRRHASPKPSTCARPRSSSPRPNRRWARQAAMTMTGFATSIIACGVRGGDRRANWPPRRRPTAGRACAC